MIFFISITSYLVFLIPKTYRQSLCICWFFISCLICWLAVMLILCLLYIIVSFPFRFATLPVCVSWSWNVLKLAKHHSLFCKENMVSKFGFLFDQNKTLQVWFGLVCRFRIMPQIHSDARRQKTGCCSSVTCCPDLLTYWQLLIFQLFTTMKQFPRMALYKYFFLMMKMLVYTSLWFLSSDFSTKIFRHFYNGGFM